MTTTLTRTPALSVPGSTAATGSTAALHTRVFRRDIQGLRALAVTLVVLYHAHVPGVSAGYVGVDVFFVISGFLITTQITGEIDRTGRLSLLSFYARRIRRLLPLALVVTITTVVVARLWGPVLQLRSTAMDAVYTALYGINFRLAAEGVDYQQANGPVSPLQHYWSLAVEEQFYVVWPLLIVAVVAVFGQRRRSAVAALAMVGCAASLYLSVTITGRSAPLAYFSVQTRAWEFGLGALVALGAVRLAAVRPALRSPLSWVGLVSIIAAAFSYDDNTAFPGTAALLPVLGCAAVIAAGCGPVSRRSAEPLLAIRPAQLIGRFSYGWYLWHWPVLVLAPAILGYELSRVHALELSVLSLWVAGLTYAAVEHPTQVGRLLRRRWLTRGAFISGAGALVSAAVLTTAPAIAGSGQYAKPLDLSSPSSIALAAALVTGSENPAVPGNLNPSLDDAADDVPVTTTNACHLDFLQVKQGDCVYGDAAAAAAETVVLFGDSHAQQWGGALDTAARTAGWRLVSWTKAACPAAQIKIVNPQLERTYTECDSWRAATIERIRALHPALVVVSQSDSVPGRAVENDDWAAQTVVTLGALSQPGTHVVLMADTPYPKTDIPSCVAEHLDNALACQVSRAQAYHAAESIYSERHAVVVETARTAGFTTIDPIDWICSATACPVIVGNTLVYRDDSHLSNTYSTLLAPVVAPLLTESPLTPSVAGETRSGTAATQPTAAAAADAS